MKLLITGFGAIVPGSTTNEELWENVKKKANLFHQISTANGHTMLTGMEPEYNKDDYAIEKKKYKYLDKQMIYSLIAALNCVEDANLLDALKDNDLSRETGIVSGSMFAQLEFGLKQVAKVEIDKSTRISPYTGMAFYYGSNVGEISAMLHTTGENCAVLSGSNIGMDAIALAKQMISFGRNEIVLAGAGENVVYDIFDFALEKQKLTAKNQYMPYAKEREGVALCNGAAMISLESEKTARSRNAKVLAEVKAVSTENCSECFFETTEAITDYLKDVMKNCLDEAGMKQEDIDLVIPSANATKADDFYEMQAMSEVFPDREEFVYTPKPVIGYGISFNTFVDIYVGSKCMEEGIIPGFPQIVKTGNETFDKMFVGTEAVARKIRNVMILHKSFIDGKVNALILGK